MKILILYDGTLHARTGLRYGAAKAREKGGSVVVLGVFDPAVFVDYDAGPRAQDLARREFAGHLAGANELLREHAPGVPVRVISEEGDADSLVPQIAAVEQADLLIVPPRYRSLRKSMDRPVFVIPGTIVVPVDNSDGSLANVDAISEEALATGSQVVLLGVLPVHLYSREEKRELEAVRKGTAARMRTIDKMLKARGIGTKSVMRSGYPDEEILKAAEEVSAAMILIPSGGDAPSELSKAAAMILDAPERGTSPVMLMTAEGAA